MTRNRTLIVISVVAAFAMLVGVAIVSAVLLTDDKSDTWTEPKPAATSAPSGLKQFYDQKVSWSSCDDSARCAWIKVPIDYAKPDGATTKLRAIVHPADGGKATGSILVNPGGPGGSAIDFAKTMAGEFGDDVRKKYDIVGVDPRGVAESSPLTCLSDKGFDAFTETDPDPDDADEITALRQSITDLGKACEKNSGELAAHVSTVEVAKDMDVVRALLGRSKLDWFGASYGTELGAVYAQLFPTNVGRMVLDGAVDPSLDAIGSSLGQTTGFQRALDAYAKDCVKQSSCPLGKDADAGLAKIADLMKQLDATPMKALAGRDLTEGQAFYGIAVTLYDKTTWTYLSQGLDAAFKGDGSVLLRLSDIYFDRKEDGSYSGNIGQVIYAVNCLDAPDHVTVQRDRGGPPAVREGVAGVRPGPRLGCARLRRLADQGDQPAAQDRGQGGAADPRARHDPRPGDALRVGQVVGVAAVLGRADHARGRRPHGLHLRQCVHHQGSRQLLHRGHRAQGRPGLQGTELGVP